MCVVTQSLYWVGLEQASVPKFVAAIPTVARHIFQLVWCG